jgi:hypothetical protein
MAITNNVTRPSYKFGSLANLGSLTNVAGQIIIATSANNRAEIYVDDGSNRFRVGDFETYASVEALNTAYESMTEIEKTAAQNKLFYIQGANILAIYDANQDAFVRVNNGIVQSIDTTGVTAGQAITGATLNASTGVLAFTSGTITAANVTNTAINGVEKDVDGTATATTNVQDTLEALKGLIDDTASDATLYAIESGASGDVLKSYQLVQGGTPTVDQVSGKVTAVSGGTTVTTINIPKDYLVKDASLDTVVAADKAEGGKFEDDSNFAVGDKYIDFTVNTVGSDGTTTHIYLNVKDLVDAYSAEANATEVQVAIDSNNVISATIVDVAASKITYKAADEVAGTAHESVGAALARLDGDDTTDGSVAKAVKDAVEALDTDTDVQLVSVSGNSVTLTKAISESDGIVEGVTGLGSTVTLSDVAVTGGAGDVAIADAGGFTSETTVEGAIQELYGALTWGTF